MSYGYLYVFSNPSMPGILNIGMTERSPYERLREANVTDTWRPPTPYKLEFAKKVMDVKQKEVRLHKMLDQYHERINPHREFFRVDIDKVREFFELMDGEYYLETDYIEEIIDKPDENVLIEEPSPPNVVNNYHEFVKMLYPTVKAQHPEWLPQDIITEVGRLWTAQKGECVINIPVSAPKAT